MVKPISPKEVESLRPQLPEEVIIAFNELILSNFRNDEAKVIQADAVNLIVDKIAKTKGITSSTQKKEIRDQIFNNEWLEIEPLYIKEGWKVTYYKPGWGETGEPCFVFKKKSR